MGVLRRLGKCDPLAILRKWPQALVPAALALLLAACSAVQLGYRNADTLLYWWLDKYADFDDPQSVQVRARIADYLAWHRANQLPRYAALLERLAIAATGELNGAQICSAWDDAGKILRDDLRRTVPDAAAMAVTLRPEQLQHLQRELDKNNREFDEKYRNASPAEIRANRLKATVQRLEWLYGPISAAQQAELARLLLASPWDANRWAGERERRQRELLALLRAAQREPAAAVERRIADYWDRVENVPEPAMRDWLDRLTRYNCDFTAQAHQLMSAEQRRAAQDKLRSIAADFRLLAASR